MTGDLKNEDSFNNRMKNLMPPRLITNNSLTIPYNSNTDNTSVTSKQSR